MAPLVSAITRSADAYRWEIVQRGLRLANRLLYLNGAMALFYGLWVVIGILLVIVHLGLFFAGKADSFERALDPFAKYGFLLPLLALFISCWIAKLYSRILWCAVPEPFFAQILAVLAVLGRLVMIYLAVRLWELPHRLLDLPARADLVLCAVFACLGLLSELLFLRSLPPSITGNELPPANYTPIEPDPEEVNEEVFSAIEPEKKSVWTRNLDDWLAQRFPRSTKVISWICPPLLFLALFCTRSEKPLGQALLIVSLIYPLILQVFWIPRQESAVRVGPTASAWSGRQRET